MIKTSFTAVTPQLNEQALVSGVQTAVKRVGDFFEARGIIGDELTPYPPRRKFPQDYPLEWTPVERAEYFNEVAAGRTTFPYKRTNTLHDSWSAFTAPTNTGAVLQISNLSGYASDVIGGFRSNTGQKMYHRITGWIPVVDLLPAFAERVNDSVQEELQLSLGDDVIIARTI